MDTSQGITNTLILAIDVGTQSIRASLFDTKGNIVAINKVPMPDYQSPESEWLELDLGQFWDRFCLTTSQLFARCTSAQISAIAGMSITTQRSTVVNLDIDGKPLRPAIIWLDQRKALNTKSLKFLDKAALYAVGMYAAVTYASKECEAHWIQENQPEIWAKTHKYLLLSGYITYKLTGQYCDSIGSMVGFFPFDYKRQKWASPHSLNHKLFRIPSEKLFTLKQPSQLLGKITEKAASETGIPKGLKLIAAASDKACEVLGSGCTDTSTICLSYGTTATVQTSSPKYLETQRFFPAYPSALPNSYNTEVMIYRGFWMINWFKEEFGHPEVHRAQTQGTTPETFFEELIKRVPPGADGLILQPYWSPGLKNPGLEARGSILGFSGIHTRAHIYRAIIEGIAYALRKGVERTQHTTGNEASKIIISGGGSQSNEIMQLTADILGKTTYRPHTYETSSLGAAVNAAVGLGIYPNHKEAVKFMTRLKDSFHPIPSNTALYNAYYHRAYQHIYPRLYPIFKQIRLISQQFKA